MPTQIYNMPLNSAFVKIRKSEAASRSVHKRYSYICNAPRDIFCEKCVRMALSQPSPVQPVHVAWCQTHSACSTDTERVKEDEKTARSERSGWVGEEPELKSLGICYRTAFRWNLAKADHLESCLRGTTPTDKRTPKIPQR